MTLPSRLCVICDDDLCARSGWTIVDVASACLDAGARFLQVRGKSLSGRRFLETVAAVVERARSADALTVVNDRADIAKMAGAGGVHVGQDDLPPSAVRVIIGPDAVVGLSTHTPEQLKAGGGNPVTYLAIGPVFGTTTKDTGYAPVGLDGVRLAAKRVELPLVAIGGITLQTAVSVIESGAQSVAVISDLMATGSPSGQVRRYLASLS